MKFINIQTRDGRGGFYLPDDRSSRAIADHFLKNENNILVDETGKEIDKFWISPSGNTVDISNNDVADDSDDLDMQVLIGSDWTTFK